MEKHCENPLCDIITNVRIAMIEVSTGNQMMVCETCAATSKYRYITVDDKPVSDEDLTKSYTHTRQRPDTEPPTHREKLNDAMKHLSDVTRMTFEIGKPPIVEMNDLLKDLKTAAKEWENEIINAEDLLTSPETFVLLDKINKYKKNIQRLTFDDEYMDGRDEPEDVTVTIMNDDFPEIKQFFINRQLIAVNGICKILNTLIKSKV